jgi:TetR/AcrR family transcriptional regulator, lmrAB and yxaGH operons repressor
MVKTVFERSDAIPLLAEAFREFGYEGATLSRITARTGLGKGSLYHFFPGGKEEMGQAVLDHVDRWFIAHIFQPLEEGEPVAAIAGMWREVAAYFCAGQRICLVGAFALDETRDRFAQTINRYFARWITALAGALVRAGKDEKTAMQLAEHAVLGVQGALVLTRATADAGLFKRALERLEQGFFL